MKKAIGIVLMFAMAVPTFADVFEGQAAYVGGTATGVNAGAVGKLDTSQEANLLFSSDRGRISIPYAKIETWKYDEVLAYHLGVIGTVVVGLLKHRQRRHMFQIQYKDDSGVNQSAVFEVAKEQPRVVVAVLEVRVKACNVVASWNDGPFEYAYAACAPPRPLRQNVVRTTTNDDARNQTAANVAPRTQK